MPYSQRHLFNSIPDTNHNANPTNTNCNSKGNHNPTNPANTNTRYCCEYGTLNSMFAEFLFSLITVLHYITVCVHIIVTAADDVSVAVVKSSTSVLSGHWSAQQHSSELDHVGRTTSRHSGRPDLRTIRHTTVHRLPRRPPGHRDNTGVRQWSCDGGRET